MWFFIFGIYTYSQTCGNGLVSIIDEVFQQHGLPKNKDNLVDLKDEIMDLARSYTKAPQEEDDIAGQEDSASD